MRIMKPTVGIIDHPGGHDEKMLLDIELAGRVCYGSQDKIAPGSAQPFVNGLINRGHYAPLEHGSVYMTLPYETDYDYEAVQFYRENPYSLVKTDADKKEAYVSTNYRVVIENSRGSDYVYRHGFIDNGNFERRVMVLFGENLAIAREFNRHRTHSICEESTRFCIAGDMFIEVNGHLIRVRDLYVKFTEKVGVDKMTTDTLSEENPGMAERCQIKGIFETGDQKCLCIRTDKRSLVLITGDHQVMMADRKFGRASDIKAGDRLFNWYTGEETVTEVIETEKPIECYEIEIEGNHNFFIDGLCLHNCNYSGEKYGSEISVIEPLRFREGADEAYRKLAGRNDGMKLMSDYVNQLSVYGVGNIGKYWTPADYWFFATLASEFSYNGLTKDCAWAPQDARDCLTLSTRTRSYHTDFVRNWKHFFNLRAFKSVGNSPHPQAMELAKPLMEEFIRRGYIKREDLRDEVK